MIFHKKMLIEIGNNKIIKTEFGFLKKKRNEGSDLANKNLYLLIYEEEVYIKKFDLPKARGELLYNLVKNELSFSVGNINNILFDYIVTTKQMNLCVEVIVFYINSKKIVFIRENNYYKSIEKITLIQFAMKKYYAKAIEEDSYIMFFVYENALYILAVKENILVANSIIENFRDEKEELMRIFKIFKRKYSEQLININNIYSSNIDIDLSNENDTNLQEMVVKVLDSYKKEKLIDSFIW